MASYCAEHPSVSIIEPWTTNAPPVYAGISYDTTRPHIVMPTLTSDRRGWSKTILNHIYEPILDPSNNTTRLSIWRDREIPTHIHARLFPTPSPEVYKAYLDYATIMSSDHEEIRKIQALHLGQAFSTAGTVQVNDHEIAMGNFAIITEEGIQFSYQPEYFRFNEWIGEGKLRFRVLKNSEDEQIRIEFLVGFVLDELLIYGLTINALSFNQLQEKMFELAKRNMLDQVSIHDLLHPYLRMENPENIPNLDLGLD